jgi:hypothetical protein
MRLGGDGEWWGVLWADRCTRGAIRGRERSRGCSAGDGRLVVVRVREDALQPAEHGTAADAVRTGSLYTTGDEGRAEGRWGRGRGGRM